MGDGKWFRGKAQRQQCAQGLRRKSHPGRTRASRLDRCVLSVEALEDRRVLATFVVTNLLDTQRVGDNEVTIAGSLRWAIERANATPAGDQILFSDNIFADSPDGTIALTNGVLPITESVDILGPGAMKLTVRQNPGANQRVFDIANSERNLNVQIAGVTITGGRVSGEDDSKGGGIRNFENLSLLEVIVEGNSASAGGGGVYVETGRLSVERSLFQDNSGGGDGGGGILNGADEEETRPTTEIINSTFTQNRSSNGSENSGGGGVLNRNGTLRISHSTFVDNRAESGFGDGVGSWGNPVAEEEGGDPPAPTVFTEMDHTIVFRMGSDSDVAVIGMTDGDEPMPLEPSFESLGWNIITTPGDQIELSGDDLAAGTNPGLMGDPDSGEPILADYGGSTPVFLPNNDPDLGPISPAIDAGNPDISGGFEQRGRHFKRVYDATNMGMDPGIVDIGAAEAQAGEFYVDGLVDETDLQYSGTVDPATKAILMSYDSGNDFTLREALEFSRKNPEVDKVLFNDSLQAEADPTLSAAPTILLKRDFGSLDIDHEVIVEGPSTWVMEVDASGTDPTPGVNNGDGTHVFAVDAEDAATIVDILISGLTIRGADQVGPGGAIYNNENLTLRNMSFTDNYATLNGGGVFTQFGNLVVDNSTFYGNSAAGSGGAIYVNTGDDPDNPIQALIVNSTITGNSAASRGAGIANANGRLTIRHSTITNNSAASTRGSGVYNFAFEDAFTEVYSSIISGNANNDVEFATGGNNVASLGYNLVGRGNASGVFVETGDRRNVLNPMLAPLSNTGGFILTHRPLVGSPVIDMGNPADAAGMADVPETDQRGGLYVRVFDGDENGSAIIDIGAYELQSVLLTVDNLSDTDDGNYTTDNLTLREAIKIANENPLTDFIDVTTVSGIITLSGSSIVITDSVGIEGVDWFNMRIFGTGVTNGPMFIVDDGNPNTTIDVTVRGLAIESARAGAIMSRENLFIDEVYFQANQSAVGGGAIQQESGSLDILGSQFSGNNTTAAGADGGAVYGVNASITITDTLLAGNSTAATGADGGAIALLNSSLVASQVVITGNIAPGGASDGGGIFGQGSAITLIDSTVSGNLTTGSNSEGAGIAVRDGSLDLVDTVVSLNKTFGSQSGGGGIHAINSTIDVNRSMIAQNTVQGIASAGAGLFMQGGSSTLRNSSVWGNVASGMGGHGGGIYNTGGDLLLRGVSVVENQATHAQSKGGGVYSDTNLVGSQTTTILNSTISGNSAALRGGGVFNADGLTNVQHSTITNNSTPFMNVGNGIASQGNGATLTRVFSSIVAGNVGAANGTGSDVDSVDGSFASSFQSLGYNLIGIGNSLGAFHQTGDLANVINPLLGVLEDNGAAADNPFSVLTHKLLEGSPAINAGSPSFNPASYTPELTTDQRGEGYDRVLRGRIDTGALESDFLPAQPADFSGDGVTDGTDFLTWQRNLGKTGAVKADGDANGDGLVNAADLGQWRAGFGSGAGGAVAAVNTSSLFASTTSATDPDSTPPAGSTGVWGATGRSYFIAASTDADAVELDADQATLAEEEGYRLAAVVDSGFAALGTDAIPQVGGYSPFGASSLSDESAEEKGADDLYFAQLGASLV